MYFCDQLWKLNQNKTTEHRIKRHTVGVIERNRDPRKEKEKERVTEKARERQRERERERDKKKERDRAKV